MLPVDLFDAEKPARASKSQDPDVGRNFDSTGIARYLDPNSKARRHSPAYFSQSDTNPRHMAQKTRPGRMNFRACFWSSRVLRRLCMDAAAETYNGAHFTWNDSAVQVVLQDRPFVFLYLCMPLRLIQYQRSEDRFASLSRRTRL